MIKWKNFKEERPPENLFILCLEDTNRSLVFQGVYKNNKIYDMVDKISKISHWAYLTFPEE